VVDVSGRTAFASGVDVDGDGKLGRKRREVDQWRRFNPRHLSSDPGDTVLAAELLATRRLIELLDSERSRVGLVSFADGASLLAPVGSDGAALAEGLAILEENFGSGATNLAAALDLATQTLVAAAGEGRKKSILVPSDGDPMALENEWAAAKAARERAEEARAAGVRIYTFALGTEEIGEEDVYAAIAAQTGGR
ncbi:MAG: vWA domain-containing protein, partial [Myxococcota bacterium]